MNRHAKKVRTATTGRPAVFAGTMGMALVLTLSPFRAAAQQVVLRVGEDVTSNVIEEAAWRSTAAE